MSAREDGSLWVGDSWLISGACHEADGTTPLDLTGGTVALRIARRGETVLDVTATIDDAPAGAWSRAITPAQQTAAGVTAGTYEYQVRATLADGQVSTQNHGTLTIHPSLF